MPSTPHSVLYLDGRIAGPDCRVVFAACGGLGGRGKIEACLITSVGNWDAIAGVTGRVEITNSSFFVPYYFDVGTGDLPFTWEGFTGIGYHASWADLSLGYRYLDFQNHEGARVQNLAMGGVIFAASFHF